MQFETCSFREDSFSFFICKILQNNFKVNGFSNLVFCREHCQIVKISLVIVHLKYVLISFSFEKLFPNATVIGIVIIIRKAMKT